MVPVTLSVCPGTSVLCATAMLAFQVPNPPVLVTGPSGPPLEDEELELEDELDELELLDDELLEELDPLDELELPEELPVSVTKLTPAEG